MCGAGSLRSVCGAHLVGAPGAGSVCGAHLVGAPRASSSRGLPGPLLGEAVDVEASPAAVGVLLPPVQQLQRPLPGGRAGGRGPGGGATGGGIAVERGGLPGQLRDVGLCGDLREGGGKEGRKEGKFAN